jgi:hypothetical protein
LDSTAAFAGARDVAWKRAGTFNTAPASAGTRDACEIAGSGPSAAFAAGRSGGMIAQEMSRRAAGDRAARDCASTGPSTASAARPRHTSAAPTKVKKVV